MIQKKVKVFQQEVAAEYQFRFIVENATVPRRQILHLINNYKLVPAQNDDNSLFRAKNHKKLIG